jgi:hypothetical protein
MTTSSQPLAHRDPPSLNVNVPDADLYVGPAVVDNDIDGLEISEAAKSLGITVDEIWRRVRNGKLVARTLRGKVLVYTDLEGLMMEEGLPPPPASIAPNQSLSPTSDIQTHTALGLQPAIHSQELALLIDHLSLAKDENREILKLTQDSMNRLTQMTDAILEMKDAMLAAKDEQLRNLQLKLTEQSEELVKVLKEKEDLETLTQSL